MRLFDACGGKLCWREMPSRKGFDAGEVHAISTAAAMDGRTKIASLQMLISPQARAHEQSANDRRGDEHTR